ASAVRRNVIASVERMTGLQVTEVNLEISDVHLPEDDEADAEKNTVRVQ
ncbi:Asp23/Gls24 family envelope stress response protein, partial [Kineococcus sp. NPDC059986]